MEACFSWHDYVFLINPLDSSSQSREDNGEHLPSAQHTVENERKVTSDAELQRLRDLLQQRDDEINVLLKMLKQEKRRAAEAEAALKDAGMAIDKRRPLSPVLGRTSPIQVEGPIPDSMTSLVSSMKSSSVGGSTASVSTSQQMMGLSSTAEQHRSGTGTSHSMIESRSSQDWKAVKAGTCTYMSVFTHNTSF